VGALGVILLMYFFPPLSVLLLITAIGLLSALLASLYLRRRVLIGLILASFLSFSFFFFFPLRLNISQYKSLSVTLNLPQAKILKEVSSPLGLINVVESPSIRHAPGLSLNLEYLDYISSALPYHLLDKPRVLIIGAGGGGEVLSALYHGSSLIEAVEIDPQVVNLVKDEYAHFSNQIFSHPSVKIFIAEGRGFIQSSQNKYDLIQLALLDSFSASSAGVYALSESYLYTKEAVKESIRHLNPQGILCITRWLKLPPRDGIKLFATAVESLQELGVENIPSQLIFIRSWATSTLLIKRSPFTSPEIRIIKDFLKERLFDPIWYPGIEIDDINHYNILPEAYYYQASQNILFGEREKFYTDYSFYIKPATDNSPYFFRFLKWKSLPHLLETMGRQWFPFIEWGYIVLIATLAQTILLSLILVILPLFCLRKKAASGNKLPIFTYFLSLGIGYMFIEISFIQRFILFLSHPIYAVAVVLAAFLFFSGWGSYLSGRIKIKRLNSVSLIVGAIILIALIYLFYLEDIFDFFIACSDTVKILLSLLFIAPLALFMGMPFPLGLARVSSKASSL